MYAELNFVGFSTFPPVSAQPKLGKKTEVGILREFWAVCKHRVEPSQPETPKKKSVLSRLNSNFSKKNRVEPAQPEIFGKKTGLSRFNPFLFPKIGRVAPAPNLICFRNFNM